MSYMFLIDDILDIAIQIEQNAEKIYRHAQEKVSNPSLASMLNWLADEEVVHANWFSDLQNKLNIPITNPKVEEMGRALLSDVVGSQSFSLEQANFSEIRQLQQLLALAIEFEKDKIMFYKLLHPFIEDNATLDFLDSIIKEEEDHIQRLQTYLDSGATEEAIMIDNL
jgi:rubrerythrin